MERWEPIEGFHYSVSTDGRIRNDETDAIKAPTIRKDGYYKVDLYDNGQRSSKRISRLVAEAFIPNPDHKPQVNHIDGNKLNNDISNLEWVNNSENMLHAFRTGLAKPHPSYGMLGKKNPNGGSKGNPIICVETGVRYKSAADAERQTGIPDSCICDCLKGHCDHAHGLHFTYV